VGLPGEDALPRRSLAFAQFPFFPARHDEDSIPDMFHFVGPAMD
jgi:hypothetical protein